MRHHKGAFSLLVLEVALGFVILMHALIIARYYFQVARPPDRDTPRTSWSSPPTLPAPARPRGRAPSGARELAALGAAGAAVAAMTRTAARRVPFPVGVLATGRRARTFIWPIRATPGIVPALGLQLIAGTDLAAARASPRPGETPVLLTATLAERLYGTTTTPSDRTLAGSTLDRGRVVGRGRDFAIGGWLPSATSIVVVDAETDHRA